MVLQRKCKGDTSGTGLVNKPQDFGKTGRNQFFLGCMFAVRIIGEEKENK
jgi:hypothetical protein